MTDKRPTEFTAARRAAFLEALACLGSVREAVAASGVSRDLYRTAMKRDVDFRDQVLMAKEDFADALEKEAYRRAVDGWDEDRMSNTGASYTVKKYDSGLLLALLKAKKPAEYGDKMKVEGTIEHQHEHTARVELSELTADQRAALRKVLASGPVGDKQISGLVKNHEISLSNADSAANRPPTLSTMPSTDPDETPPEPNDDLTDSPL